MRKIMPQTIAAQLIAVLVVVLIIGQAINLFVILGERRVQARASQFNSIIAESVLRAQSLPIPGNQHIPFAIQPSKRHPGAYFVTGQNRAAITPGTKALPKYEQQYETVLRNAGLSPLKVTVVLRLNRKRSENDQHLQPPPRPIPNQRRPNWQANDGRPPPRPRGLRPPPPHRLGPGGPAAPNMQEIILSAELEPGIWYNVIVPHVSIESITSRFLLATFILIFLTVLAAWFFARRITRPLSNLASAADRLGRGQTDIMLEEKGPSDLREAAAAFNQMQIRLTRVLETQRTMLRAIGHDLRTPITALRIRAENIPTDAGREKFIATLDDMTDMTEEILNWSKDVSGLEENAAVDLDALLASLTDDYKDQGLDVGYEENDPLILAMRRVSLKRAITNLIDNALKYGKQARVTMTAKDDIVSIHIRDKGPGIPPAKMEDVLKPFVRLETSRSKETGGIGLGLSITESIIQTSGGQLVLKNQAGGGLCATIILPISNV